MLTWLWSPFYEFDFMLRALIGGAALSLSAPPIGVFLVLRRMSLTGDAISHAILPGVAVGFVLAGLSIEAMTVGGLIAGSIIVLLSGAVARLTKNGEDNALAAFYLMSLALGVLLISWRGNNVDLLHVLFGSVLALDNTALTLLCTVSTITLLGLAIIYRPLVMECVDPDFLTSVSRLGSISHISFLLLAVLNLVGGFQALGTLMAVGLMVLPASAARYWTTRLGWMIVLSVLFALMGILGGLLSSYYWDWPVSSMIILWLGSVYIVSVLLGINGGLTRRYFIHYHLKA